SQSVGPPRRRQDRNDAGLHGCLVCGVHAATYRRSVGGLRRQADIAREERNRRARGPADLVGIHAWGHSRYAHHGFCECRSARRASWRAPHQCRHPRYRPNGRRTRRPKGKTAERFASHEDRDGKYGRRFSKRMTRGESRRRLVCSERRDFWTTTFSAELGEKDPSLVARVLYSGHFLLATGPSFLGLFFRFLLDTRLEKPWVVILLCRTICKPNSASPSRPLTQRISPGRAADLRMALRVRTSPQTVMLIRTSLRRVVSPPARKH